jgi:predicted aspartyl protease
MSPLWSLLLFAFASLASAKFSVEYVSYGPVGAVETETNIPLAPYSLPFIGKAPRPASHKHHWEVLQTYLNGGQSTSPLAGTLNDGTYSVNITVGGQHITVIVDTGR